MAPWVLPYAGLVNGRGKKNITDWFMYGFGWYVYIIWGATVLQYQYGRVKTDHLEGEMS